MTAHDAERAVVVTAGHVDHGKSSLVRALTGTDPDRYAEEKRRGMTLDLGFAGTRLPSGRWLAVVDVPGHERYVATMLAGAGPVPVAVVVVAADEGWQPQSEEHLQVLDALDVRHGLLVVTKADLADPAPVREDALARLVASSMGTVAAVAVSTRSGLGLAELRAALDRLLDAVGAPDGTAEAPMRLWVDRSFTVRGSGTVVTGTLATGQLRVADRLETAPGRVAVVRGLQSHSDALTVAGPVSRVAVNLRGTDLAGIGRGDALVTPDRWTWTELVDGLARPGDDVESMPAQAVAHLGSAAVPVSVRPLAGHALRLRLMRPLPCHVGDRMLVRDPGAHRILATLTVVDVDPPPLDRRGAARHRARALDTPLTAASEITRRGTTSLEALRRAGFNSVPVGARRHGELVVSEELWESWAGRLAALLDDLPDDAEPTVEALRGRLRVPSATLFDELLAAAGSWEQRGGRLRRRDASPSPSGPLAEVLSRLAADPFDAPDAETLAAAGIGRAELAGAVRDGRLLALGHGVYVHPSAPERALGHLAALPAEFTTSEARQALGLTRRVAVPLLEHLDLTRRTRRVDGTRRRLVSP